MHTTTFNQTKNLQYENNIKQLAMQAHNAHYIPTPIWLPDLHCYDLDINEGVILTTFLLKSATYGVTAQPHPTAIGHLP